MWALLDNSGACRDIVSADPADRFSAGVRVLAIPASLVGVIDNAWHVVDGRFTPPSPGYLRDKLLMIVAARRWAVEAGGIVLPDGTRIATGIDDQNRISAALAGMERYGLDKVDFKATTGWVSLSYEQLKAIGGAVVAHVQAAFTAERVHAEALRRLDSVDALLAYDWQAGWPG